MYYDNTEMNGSSLIAIQYSNIYKFVTCSAT